MSRGRFDDGVVEGFLMRGPHYKEYQGGTLTGTIAIPNTAHSVLVFDPGGAARNVDLPAANNDLNRGRVFWVVNLADAAEALTVRHNGGATIMTVNQGKIGIAMQVGTAGAPQTAGWFGSALP